MMIIEDAGSMDNFFAEVEAIDEGPWYKKLWYYRVYWLRLPYTWPKDRYYDLIAFWQRGRRGWADRDTWSLDYHLARTLGPMVRYLAESDHGCPPGFGLNTKDDLVIMEMGGDHEAWNAFLLEIADGCDAYIQMQEGDDKYLVTTYEPALEKMRKLFEYYPYLWS